jgi:glutathione peroxidase
MSSTKSTIYDFKPLAADGKPYSIEGLKGKTILVVNVASKCGFTPQYDGLETLYKKYQSKGLVILGFPCNQFGGQEPGTNSEIQEFCRLNHGVTFPILGKVDVNGDKADPIYTWLKSQAPGILGTEAIKWNFTKFLVSKDGNVLERFAPAVKPEEMASAIEKAIG